MMKTKEKLKIFMLLLACNFVDYCITTHPISIMYDIAYVITCLGLGIYLALKYFIK